MNIEAEQDGRYAVVINHEEQYSIWQVGQPVPAGWREVGRSRAKEDCLTYVREVWTDMRPLSLRLQMDDADA